MNLQHLTHIASQSGGILYLMAVLLFVALTVILERGYSLNRLQRRGERLTRGATKLADLGNGDLAELCNEAEGLPHESLLRVPLHHPEIRTPERLSALMEEAIMVEIPHVDRNLWVVDTIITLAPLLGLLGTIIGMFNAFQVLGQPGSAPSHVTGGVAEALIATASGLFIAIIGVVSFNALNQRVREVVHQFETISRILSNRAHAPRPVMTTRSPQEPLPASSLQSVAGEV